MLHVKDDGNETDLWISAHAIAYVYDSEQYVKSGKKLWRCKVQLTTGKVLTIRVSGLDVVNLLFGETGE